MCGTRDPQPPGQPGVTSYYSDVRASGTTSGWGRCSWERCLLGWIALLSIAAATSAAEAQTPRPPAPGRPPAPFPIQRLWQTALGTPVASPPALDGQRWFALLRTGSVVAVDVNTGALLWTARVDGRGGVATDGLRVVVPTDGAVEALDPATGAPLWRRPVGGSPVLSITAAGGWVIAVLEPGSVRALRADTGEQVWEAPLADPSAVVPRLAGDLLFVASRVGDVHALRVTDGSQAWVTRVEGEPAGFAEREDRLYFGTRGKRFYCLNARRGDIEWRWRIGAEIVGAPLIDDRHVYLVAFDNLIRALDRRNGAQRWRKPLTARPLGTPVLVGGVIVPPCLAPDLQGFASSDGATQGRYAAERELAAAPLLAARPYTLGGEILLILLGDGSVSALQRRVEPPVAPLTALPGVPVPLTPPTTAAPTPPSAAR